MAKTESDKKNQNRCKRCKQIVGVNYNAKTGRVTLAKHNCVKQENPGGWYEKITKRLAKLL